MIRNKKVIYYLSVLIILIYLGLGCFISKSYSANTAVVSLDAQNNQVEKNEEIEIVLNLENNKTAAFSANLYFDNTKLEYISGPENINLLENKIIYVWYDGKGRRRSQTR